MNLTSPPESRPSLPPADGTSSAPSSPRERWTVLGICLLLTVAVWLVFGQTLHFDFVNFDDNENVYENHRVTAGLSLEGVWWALTHSQLLLWTPLTTLSHMTVCELCGVNPAGHHVVNVLLHVVNVLLLFSVLRQLTGSLWRSALVALIFAIHPARAESVAWVTERKDVLSGLFFLLTLNAYLDYARQPFAWKRYLGVVVFYVLGLMSKPMLMTLPVVLLILDYWPLGRWSNRAAVHALIREKIPFFVLAVAIFVITILSAGEVIESPRQVSQLLLIANATVSYAVYLGQVVWPFGLAAVYPHPEEMLPWGQVALAGIVLVLISGWVWKERRTHPYLVAGWCWFLVILFPVIGLLKSGIVARADRYTYLAHIGLYVAMVWGLAEWSAGHRRWRWMLKIGACAGVLLLGVVGWQQTSTWRDTETLWRRAIACTVRNHPAHNNLGIVFSRAGRVEEAIIQYQKALEINPQYSTAHNNLGVALAKIGRIDEALTHYQKALDIKPTYHLARNNLGATLLEAGRVAEAIPYYQRTLELNPRSTEARSKLALIMALSSDPALHNGPKAVEFAKEAVRLSEVKNLMYLDTLAAAYAGVGRFDEAARTAQEALVLARAAKEEKLIQQVHRRVELYRAGQPCGPGDFDPAYENRSDWRW